MTINLPSVSFTVFPSTDATTKQAKSTTWAELVGLLKDPPEYTSKKACPLISGATYGERKTEKGCLRHSANVLAVYFVEGDYDGEEVTPEEAAQRLQAANVEAVVYTTASHTAKAPRWRVLAPLSAPCAPADRRRHVATLNGALGGILNAESFTLSQSFFFGRVAGAPYTCVHVEGEPVDLDLMSPETYPAGTSPQQAEGDDDSMPEKVTAETVADLREALQALPISHADDYPRCVAVLQNLKHLEWCGRSEAEELARAFAQRSGKFEEAWFARKWHRQLHPWRGHYRKIFADAQTSGWTNPRKKPDPADVLQQLRGMDAERLKAEWADLAAPLSPEAADEAMALVHRPSPRGHRSALPSSDVSVTADHGRLSESCPRAFCRCP